MMETLKYWNQLGGFWAPHQLCSFGCLWLRFLLAPQQYWYAKHHYFARDRINPLHFLTLVQQCYDSILTF